MSSNPFDPHALAKIISRIKADADRNRPTDIAGLANELHPVLPDLSYNEVVTLITKAVIAINAPSETQKTVAN